ncbi:hypothetical protein HanHA300_Chr13g0503391 [Helianthus annuus]|nr:hypothetical protein HanHA300_Chr13g0503391 [Helianthus annuus]KAJ0499629.1 hypothetical protein HanHA89_Chr13g0536111 [Helianthus annuus]KAJ0630912.1 hypothetical protein HanLR1_Chr17g0648331 [Helianthus annuus]KAJ0677139.1 hypothetical protein HanOQP8_Chr12g0433601 [Helianthus annuus]
MAWMYRTQGESAGDDEVCDNVIEQRGLDTDCCNPQKKFMG